MFGLYSCFTTNRITSISLNNFSYFSTYLGLLDSILGRKSGLEVIKLKYSFKLKIKRNDWLFADTFPQAANHCAYFDSLFSPVAKSAVRSKVVVLLWSIHCLLVVLFLFYVLLCTALILSSFAIISKGKEIAGCFTLLVLLASVL